MSPAQRTGRGLRGRLVGLQALGKSEEAEFIVLKDGRIFFQGYVGELRASTDPYLKAYLSGWVPPLFE